MYILVPINDQQDIAFDAQQEYEFSLPETGPYNNNNNDSVFLLEDGSSITSKQPHLEIPHHPSQQLLYVPQVQLVSNVASKKRTLVETKRTYKKKPPELLDDEVTESLIEAVEKQKSLWDFRIPIEQRGPKQRQLSWEKVQAELKGTCANLTKLFIIS